MATGTTRASKPSSKASEAYGAKAYANFTATVKWESRQAEYYDALKKWANVARGFTIPSDVDHNIQMMFSNLKTLPPTDPALASADKIKLFGALSYAWIMVTDSIPEGMRDKEGLERFKLQTNVASPEEARVLQGRLLGIHLLRKPFVDSSVVGAEHFDYFSSLVADKAAARDYHTDPHAWWMVHDVLYNSWLKMVGDSKPSDSMVPPPPLAPWEKPGEKAPEPAEEIVLPVPPPPSAPMEEPDMKSPKGVGVPPKLAEIYKNLQLQLEMAKNKDLDINIALDLAKKYSFAKVGIALAENTSHEEVIEVLAADHSDQIRDVVARRTRMASLLTKLATDEAAIVKNRVAMNENTPAPALFTLAVDILPGDAVKDFTTDANFLSIEKNTLEQILSNPNLTNEIFNYIRERVKTDLSSSSGLGRALYLAQTRFSPSS